MLKIKINIEIHLKINKNITNNLITLIIIIIVISNRFIYEESGYENATNKHSPITNYT